MKIANIFGFVLLSLTLVETCLADDQSKQDNTFIALPPASANSNVYFSNLETADQLKDPSNFGQLIQQHIVRRQRNQRHMKKKQAKKTAVKNMKPTRQKTQKTQKEHKKRKNVKSRAAVTHKKQAPKKASKSASKSKPKSANKRPQKSGQKKHPQKVHNQGKLRLRLKAKKTKRAGSSCSDDADNCDEFITFCPVAEYKSILSQYCHMSCGYCARDSDECNDATQFQSSCRSWAGKGFCTSSFFDKNTIRAMCSKSCKLCAKGPKPTNAPQGSSTTPAVVQPGVTQSSTTSGTTGTAGSSTTGLTGSTTSGTTPTTTSGSTSTTTSTTSTTTTTPPPPGR